MDQNQNEIAIRELIYFILIEYKFRFDGQVVESANSTIYSHNNIIHMASYLGEPLTTGSWSIIKRASNHAKTELMNLQTGEWNTQPDYPFAHV